MDNTEKKTISYAGHTLHQLEEIKESAMEAKGVNHIDHMQTRLDRLKTSGVVACWTHSEEDHVLWSQLPPLEDRTEGTSLIDALTFAEEHKDETLKNCIERLRLIDHLQGTRTYLMNDFSPYSFYFTRWRDVGPDEEGVSVEFFDGKRRQFAGNGGLIYHGKHDNGGDGGAPTFSVSMNPVNGWSIHT
mgnify:CR=1 FL=1